MTPALAFAGPPGAPSLTVEQRASLAEGKVLVLSAPKDSEEAFVTGVAEIRSDAAGIWSILTSLDHVRASSKAVKSVDSYGDEFVDPDHRVMHLAYVLKVGFSEIHYHVRRDIRPSMNWLAWKLDAAKENDIEDTTGSYVTYPGSQPGTVLFVYRARIKTGKALPQWLEEELTQNSLKKYIGYVKRVAEGG